MFVSGSQSFYQWHPKPVPSCLSLLSSAHQPKFWLFYREYIRSKCFSVHLSVCERQDTYHLAVYYNGKNAGPCSSNTMVTYLFEYRIQYWADPLKKQHSVVIFFRTKPCVSSLIVTKWVQHQCKCVECCYETEAWLKCLCVKCLMEACVKQMFGQV